MARYIDAEKFAERIRLSPAFKNAGFEGDLLQRVVLDLLDNAHTADVVEVVRCGKCKHGEVSVISKTKDGEETVACYCNAKNKVTDLDYYCPCGERRDA